MNRTELQRLAEDRILDAEALLKAKRWSGAYHLAGYAVECALKACVLAYVEKTGVIFEDKKYAEQCWTHNLAELMKLAALEPEFGKDCGSRPALLANWLLVKDWKEDSRYRSTPHFKAKRLVKAITDKANGVLSWIRNRW